MSEVPLSHVSPVQGGANKFYRGTSLIRTPPWDRYRSLGLVLLKGPTWWRFLICEAPLYEGCMRVCLIDERLCQARV